jgi:hypothetical protein
VNDSRYGRFATDDSYVPQVHGCRDEGVIDKNMSHVWWAPQAARMIL